MKRFFEIPNILFETISYVETLKKESDIICNIIQADFWKNLNLPEKDNSLVLPLIVFFDDYESNNPLRSHNGVSKCGAVYCSVACLPPTFQSKLENIILFSLFNSLDRVAFGNKLTFSKLISELEFLEKNGIDLNVPKVVKLIIYFSS